MNKAQKILTTILLSVFTLSFICFPWRSYNGVYHIFSPILIEPKSLGIYPNQWTNYLTFYQDWKTAAILWAWLAVIYCGLMFILAPTRK